VRAEKSLLPKERRERGKDSVSQKRESRGKKRRCSKMVTSHARSTEGTQGCVEKRTIFKEDRPIQWRGSEKKSDREKKKETTTKRGGKGR